MVTIRSKSADIQGQLNVQSSLVNPANSVPSGIESELSIPIGNKYEQIKKLFSIKNWSLTSQGFRIRQGTYYRGITVHLACP